MRPGPPAMPQAGAPPLVSGGGYGGGLLSIDFEILEFTWRSIVLLIGFVLIIPAPWAMVWYLRWIVPCLRVPGRPNLGFTGQAMTLVPWYFGALVLLVAVSLSDIQWLNNLMFLVQIALYWLLLKWMVANLASNGQPLGLSFSGSFWAYLGWTILAAISSHHHHRLGLGLRCLDALGLPEYPGHTARNHLQRHADWSFSGARS